MLGWSLVVGAVWCGAFAAVYELVWFKMSRTMVHVVLRHVRREGSYSVAVAKNKKVWSPAAVDGRKLVSGPGEATYSRSGDRVVLELARPGIEGGPERFEGPEPDLMADGPSDTLAPGRVLRGLGVYRVGLEVLPAGGWLIGALIGRGGGVEFVTCWFGWIIANFLTIGTLWITLGVGAFRRLSRVNRGRSG